MNSFKGLFFLLIFVAFGACSSRFPVDKRYWTPEDYKNVLFEIEYKTPKGEQYPRFSDPETAEVMRKLVDPENYKVLLEDAELGLNYRNELSQEFFDHYQNMTEVYRVMDRQDKYVYAEELVEIEKFGLGLQVQYFNLGNERIRQESDSPESPSTKEVLGRNEQTVIKNFSVYLDHIKDERYFSSSAASLAEGITIHFFSLIETFPQANYALMESKAKAMLEKTQVPELKNALNSLLTKLDAIKKPV